MAEIPTASDGVTEAPPREISSQIQVNIPTGNEDSAALNQGWPHDHGTETGSNIPARPDTPSNVEPTDITMDNETTKERKADLEHVATVTVDGIPHTATPTLTLLRKELFARLLDYLDTAPEKIKTGSYIRIVELLNILWEADKLSLRISLGASIGAHEVALKRWIDMHNQIKIFQERTGYTGKLDEGWILHLRNLAANRWAALRALSSLKLWVVEVVNDDPTFEAARLTKRMANIAYVLMRMPEFNGPDDLEPAFGRYNGMLLSWFD